MRHRRALVTATLTCLVSSLASAAAPPAYEIVDLGVLGDGTNPNVAANATGLNELGHVAGLAEDDDLAPHAVLWRDGEIIDLGTLDVGGFGYAKGVNDLDSVVGWCTAPIPDGGGAYTGRPFVWTEGTGMVDPAFGEGFNGECWGINNHGQLAITLGTAHCWDPTLGLVPIEYPDVTAGSSRAWEVNNNGIVCGEARRADGNLHAYRYEIATATITELAFDPALEEDTIAYGINDLDDVVGISYRLDDSQRAALWAGDGTVIYFPAEAFGPIFPYDRAEHVNNHGDVVGVVYPNLPGISRIGWIAYGVTGGNGTPVQHDLRTLLSPADQARWTLLHPFEINDRGQLCGIGVVDGSTRAFLMTPCYADADVNRDGSVDALDFLALIGQWGSPCTGTCEADITGPAGAPDGDVDALDYLLLIAQWGMPGECER
jgi:probable HAF family extracellular repeat protein